MDFIHDGRNVWATEVNPRYTASVEIYEHAFGVPLSSAHRAAFDFRSEDSRLFNLKSKDEKPVTVGKVVIYADRDLIVPAWNDWAMRRDPFLPELGTLADRPKAGSRVPRGFPICSLFAAGDSESSCRHQLNQTLAEFQTHFLSAGWEISIPVLKRD
jgi:predicted ATP-grasp superfamily ATP-dependent carboligase